MVHKSRPDRLLKLLGKPNDAFRFDDWTLDKIDPQMYRSVARVTVWARWFVFFVAVSQFIYRPGFWYFGHFEYLFLLLPLAGSNGLIHYRLLTNKEVTWRWMLLLVATDMIATTIGVVIQGGFDGFLFVAYYPHLALFVVVFGSLMIAMTWTTITAVTYSYICLTFGPGLDYVAGQEKELLVRLAAMYALVLCVSLVASLERKTRHAAAERERALRLERIELARDIHDTTAQSAYMIGLGIDAAKARVEAGNSELKATLEATSRLSRSAIWELRHPINKGGIYDGQELCQALKTHATSFTNITSVPVEFTQTGEEPDLPIETKSILFTIAHNALTNAYRHAEPRRVSIVLEFDSGRSRLSVSDDGIGLRGDYAKRGQGLANMRRNAERVGGYLVIDERGQLGGASVTCVVPVVRF